MRRSTHPNSIRRDALERAFAALIRVRLALAPMVVGTLGLTFAYLEPVLWRRALVTCVLSALIIVSVIEYIRYRSRGIGALMVPFNIIVMVVGQALAAFASGGLFSPMLGVLVVVTALVAVLCEGSTILLVVAAVQLPALWIMAAIHATAWPVPTLIPEIFGGASALEDGPAPWVAAALLSVVMLVAARLGTEVRRLFETLFDEAMSERDRSLAILAEQSQLLTTLSGEIAHELKNPLASVKGLSSLIAKDLDGKPGERMRVLRREVDRMQTILEEFLNFSRPLVPLALSEIELGRLAADVARLHEGMASERGVTIAASAERPTWLRCDSRKVRQILVNLVQNALDVAPHGSQVRVVVDHDEREARLRVQDAGPGVDREIAERVFDAGTTTKEHGSGLGLAVARSLARQQGGELTLASRDAGGAEARLTLPRHPSEQIEAA